MLGRWLICWFFTNSPPKYSPPCTVAVMLWVPLMKVSLKETTNTSTSSTVTPNKPSILSLSLNLISEQQRFVKLSIKYVFKRSLSVFMIVWLSQNDNTKMYRLKSFGDDLSRLFNPSWGKKGNVMDYFGKWTSQ